MKRKFENFTNKDKDKNITLVEKYKSQTCKDLLLDTKTINDVETWVERQYNNPKSKESKVLILRGHEGSGKFTLAHNVLEKYDFKNIIFYDGSEKRSKLLAEIYDYGSSLCDPSGKRTAFILLNIDTWGKKDENSLNRDNFSFSKFADMVCHGTRACAQKQQKQQEGKTKKKNKSNKSNRSPIVCPIICTTSDKYVKNLGYQKLISNSHSVRIQMYDKDKLLPWLKNIIMQEKISNTVLGDDININQFSIKAVAILLNEHDGNLKKLLNHWDFWKKNDTDSANGNKKFKFDLKSKPDENFSTFNDNDNDEDPNANVFQLAKMYLCNPEEVFPDSNCKENFDKIFTKSFNYPKLAPLLCENYIAPYCGSGGSANPWLTKKEVDEIDNYDGPLSRKNYKQAKIDLKILEHVSDISDSISELNSFTNVTNCTLSDPEYWNETCVWYDAICSSKILLGAKGKTQSKNVPKLLTFPSEYGQDRTVLSLKSNKFTLLFYSAILGKNLHYFIPGIDLRFHLFNVLLPLLSLNNSNDSNDSHQQADKIIKNQEAWLELQNFFKDFSYLTKTTKTKIEDQKKIKEKEITNQKGEKKVNVKSTKSSKSTK